jgi:plastin-1
MSQISLKNFPELVLLLEEGEDLAKFMKLPPESILLRWVNYHLGKAGSAKKLTNFSTDVMVKYIYWRKLAF